MSLILAKIEEIEEGMARRQPNPATAMHVDLLKAKLAKLRQAVLNGEGPEERARPVRRRAAQPEKSWGEPDKQSTS
jgi:ribosome-interacting GTPase 1